MAYRDDNEALRAALEAERTRVRKLEEKLNPKKKRVKTRFWKKLRKVLFTPSIKNYDDRIIARGFTYTAVVFLLFCLCFGFKSCYQKRAEQIACGNVCTGKDRWTTGVQKYIDKGRMICGCEGLDTDEYKVIVRNPTK